MNNSSDITFDQQHVWHPYASIPNNQPPFLVKSAQGVYLQLDNDQSVIDGMSSWWSAIHGYNHPTINQAAKEQIDTLAHVMFGGLTHEPAITYVKN